MKRRTFLLIGLGCAVVALLTGGATSSLPLNITPSTGTLTIANGKVFTASNNITVSGTDGSTLNVGAGGTLASGAFSVPGYVQLQFTGAAISAASTGDLATVATGLSRYLVQAVYAETTAASGTLALGTIDIRTATAGGGSSVLAAPTALVSLTAVDLAQSITPLTLGTVQTAANLTLRQTFLSANAGTISVVVVLIAIP